MDSDGAILESQCECTAGTGPKAHCKHVAAILCALVDFKRNTFLQLHETCTQKLQSFRQPKKHIHSPVECSKLFQEGFTRKSDFDPRPVAYRNQPGYSNFFRTVILNAPFHAPLKQLYSPALQSAISHDHDYLKKHPEELFLEREEI